MPPLRTVALGARVQTSPFGGGNQFAQALAANLRKHNLTVVFDLDQPDIDLILLTSVKPWARGTSFDVITALRYTAQHPLTKLVLRVNDCDERKGNRVLLLNNLLRASMKSVDHTVFVSQWLQDLLLGPDSALRQNSSVIHSGADPVIFNSHGRTLWDGQEPLKIVTHHWSSSWYKGWDVYQTFDDWLSTVAGRNFRFTFIGNVWPSANLQHTTAIPPHSGQQLAHLLQQHHVYVSASQYEPAGMHYIEALQCGLPILWRRSGSLPEYCKPYGISFSGPHDFLKALVQIKEQYTHWHAAVAQHTYTAIDMCQAYVRLFQKLSRENPSARPRTISHLRVQQGLLWVRDSMA